MEFVDIVEEPFRPTALMQKIHDYLVLHPGASKRALRELGNAKGIDLATELLIKEGYVSSKDSRSEEFALCR